MGLSIRAYARRRGVSDTAVRKAIRAGRIEKEPDGTIDPGKADAAWAASTDQAQQRKALKPAANEMPQEEAPAHEVSAQEAPAQEAPASTSDSATFARARAAHEAAKAQRARLELRQRQGELVERAKAERLVFDLARQERDSWLTWPARVSAQMAHDLGVDDHKMQQVLDDYVRRHLQEIADIEPDFG